MEGLPFAVGASDAERLFGEWTRRSTPMWSPPPISALYSYFVPFWAFEADIMTAVDGREYHKFADGASMMVYGGHTFRRRMTEVLKCDTAHAKPFSSSMMEGVGNRVDVDEWSLFERTALSLVREQLLAEEAELHYARHPGQEISVSYSGLVSRRVMVPAHIVEYEHGGGSFRVFINGVTGDAFGIEQRSLAGEAWAGIQAAGHVLDRLQRQYGSQSVFGAGIAALRVVGGLAARLALSPPFLAAAVIGTVSYSLWLGRHAQRQRDASYAEWAETRARELAQQATMTDDWRFRPSGRTRRDRREDRRHEGETWQQHRSRRRQNAERTKYRSSQSSSAGPAADGGSAAAGGRFRQMPRADLSDPYSVLGLPRSADSSDVHKAFRRELMRWHPDHNRSGEYDPAALQERTRAIIDAYKQLKRGA